MARTDSDAVKLILLKDYDDNNNPSLEPFIEAATTIVDRIYAQSVADDDILTDPELELIERWLSAHGYAMSDQPYASRSNLRGSGSFQGQTGKYFEATKYGQMAVSLDRSGYLASLIAGSQPVARATWLGKYPRDQRPYEER